VSGSLVSYVPFMTDALIPDEVKEFILDRIHSVMQLEGLLLLRVGAASGMEC
jgi:hypothetical protein